jgi:hypothetical protein
LGFYRCGHRSAVPDLFGGHVVAKRPLLIPCARIVD